MAEEQVQQVPLDSEESSITDWKAARNKGETTVKVAEKEPEEEKKEEKAEPEEEKPKARGGFQVKIDRLTKHNAELEKRAEAAEKKAQELAEKNGKADDVVRKADGEPKEEDFNGDTIAYLKAQARWEVRQEIKADKEAQERAQEQAEAQAIFDAHNEKVSEARAKYEDFDEVMNAAKTPWNKDVKGDVQRSEAFHVAMVESGNGGELMWYYANHPEDFAKLAGLSPAKIQMAVGRIADKLETKDEDEEAPKGKPKLVEADGEEEEEKPKKVPVRPINGAVKTDVPLAEMTSLRDYKKARNAGRIR